MHVSWNLKVCWCQSIHRTGGRGVPCLFPWKWQLNRCHSLSNSIVSLTTKIFILTLYLIRIRKNNNITQFLDKIIIFYLFKQCFKHACKHFSYIYNINLNVSPSIIHNYRIIKKLVENKLASVADMFYLGWGGVQGSMEMAA